MKKHLHSLRFRYAVSVIVLIVLIASAATVAYRSIRAVEESISEDLLLQAKVGEAARQIRIHVLDSTLSIDAYLLDPTRKQYKRHALAAINLAIEQNQSLVIEYTKLQGDELGLLGELTDLLQQLKNTTNKLFMVREDTNQQYPSLAVGASIMQPNRNNFNNAIALAINELHEEGSDKTDHDVYQDFLRARFLWTQVLSNFRLYLANRVGSFNEVALPVQEKAIDTMYGELEIQLRKLGAYDEAGKLKFQSSEALAEMIDAGANWYGGFMTVKKIHNTDAWRMDSKIMKEELVPLVERMSTVLEDLEHNINQTSANALSILAEAANKNTTLLLWGSILLVGFITALFISTNRLVFNPIASVVKALKAETFGKEGVVLPNVRSRETEALIDAFSEMSKSVHKRQTALEYQALHDALTALPNRTLLQERMSQHLSACQREKRTLSLLMIDLDRFKEINDAMGHHVGDQVLIEVGLRLSNVLREVDTVARLGGDEFAVLLPDCGESNAKVLAKKLLEVMNKVFIVDDVQISVDMSVGIACYPQHGMDVSNLLQHADVAMYLAKQNKLGVSVYDSNKDEYSVGRLELISDLRAAIESDTLKVAFQPMYDVASEKIISVEALLRWIHPEHGFIPPDQIILIAEQTGLINPLTYWVMKNALRQAEILRQEEDISVAINISVFNLKDPAFVSNVRTILAGSNIPNNKVILEITESAMMSNPVNAVEVLSELDLMDVKLAVDDFGTGFSSLAYLKQLPVDELKIDKSFIIGMQHNNSDEVIVHSTIELAHNLGLEVVAEGVENDEILQKLKSYQCDVAQGYHFCKPMSLEELQKRL